MASVMTSQVPVPATPTAGAPPVSCPAAARKEPATSTVACAPATQASGANSAPTTATAALTQCATLPRASVTATPAGTGVTAMPSAPAMARPASSSLDAASAESVCGARTVSACASVYMDAATRQMEPAPAGQDSGGSSAESRVRLASMDRTAETGGWQKDKTKLETSLPSQL